MGNLGRIHQENSDIQKAFQSFEQALGISREIKDQYGQAVQLDNLGNMYGRKHDLDKALDYCNQALTMYQTLGDRWRQGSVMSNIAHFHRLRGDIEDALTWHQYALQIQKALRNWRGMADQLSNLALAFQIQGDMDKAIGHEVATFGAGILVPMIPVVGPALAFLDACGSAITGISVIEETVGAIENGAEGTFEAGFDSEYNREWDATAPKVENLENYISKLEKSIQNSESTQKKNKQVKLLQKIQKYKSEVETRKNIREFNTKMFNSEFTVFEP